MIPEDPQITCGVCGESSDMWDACHDENGESLDPDHFRCPVCGCRFYRHHNEGRILGSGFYLPGEIEIRKEG